MVYVHVNENRKPLLVADVKTNNTYLDKKSFQYFSVLGVKSFWDFSTTPDCINSKFFLNFILLTSSSLFGHDNFFRKQIPLVPD